MPIISSDIQFRLSGGASNADPDASLGGAKSSVEIVDGVVANLFDNVRGAESAAGSTEYRCFYIHNAHATLTMQDTVVYIDANTPSPDTEAAIGLGSAAVGGTEPTIADETTAPAGVTFSAAAGAGSALAIGDIAPGSHKAVWVRRVVSAGASAYNNDGVDIRVVCDTAA